MQIKSCFFIYIKLIPHMIIELKALKVMQNSPGIAELICILICQKENFDSPDPYDLERASLKHTVVP